MYLDACSSSGYHEILNGKVLAVVRKRAGRDVGE